MKKIIYVLMLIVCLQAASAAILHGAIYDSRLNKLNDVFVEVNSSPPQTFLSKEGQYSFVLDPGIYKIVAKYRLSGSKYLYTSHNVTIGRDGYFVMDLFLVPSQRIEMPTGAFSAVRSEPNYLILGSLVGVILLGSVGFTIYKLRRPKVVVAPQSNGFDQSTDDLIKIIQEAGGRATQRDIRKKIPLSEAKVSLMVSDLESRGILKKIKKGRGNIIILEKNK